MQPCGLKICERGAVNRPDDQLTFSLTGRIFICISLAVKNRERLQPHIRSRKVSRYLIETLSMRKTFGTFLRRRGLIVLRHVKQLRSLFFLFNIAQLRAGIG